MSEQVTQNYRGLKAAVIIMGVLLILGTAALIAGLIRQAQKIDDHFSAAPARWEAVLPPELAGEVSAIAQDGARLSLLIAREGGHHIVIIDTGSGDIVGHLRTAVGDRE
ncbi:MAG TPA: hypothetical protein DCZ07_02625 [Alphaproteobacteria bacterium]|nr:hypothetical protein [Alphaproteobacteria bacterium]HBC52722.1 hypothetical protein [Alphaproteobacteria bacterium]